MNLHRNLTEWHEAPALFTADEFMQVVQGPPFTDWSGKVELVEGVIVRMSPAYIPHWNAQRNARQIHVMASPRDGDYLDRRIVDFGHPIAVPGTDTHIVIE